MKKSTFWSLFQPAFERDFTQKNIESGFKQTGLNPRGADVVLCKLIKPPSRPVTSESSSSQISQKDLLNMRRQARQQRDAAEMQLKLLDFAEKMKTENTLLRRELASAKRAAQLEKKRRKRGKPLIDELGQTEPYEAKFFSPNKIVAMREAADKREQEKKEAEAQRAKEKLQKERNKLRKEQDRQKKKAEREKQRLLKVIKKQELQLQKEGSKQLLQESRTAARTSKKRSNKSSEALEATAIASSSNSKEVVNLTDDEASAATSRSSRPQRQRQLPKRFRTLEN
ncbi:hypothetical protein DM02DRAFT_662744 [Periconia macrospinosa]|uniref:Uncharacterized protein n=1 Tax=Periconia macrospinosa TaxID=97972 RepID=A0A2V1D4R3_9PLEO|nr:hypothetical protein DM02DRAFT_662744 [Periconia macrospinosa]